MKLILILFAIVICQYSFSQTNDTIYHSKGITCTFMNEVDQTIISEVPLGKNVTIHYDAFFKSYKILYTNVDGEKEQIKLKYYSGKEKENFKTYVDANGKLYSLTSYLDFPYNKQLIFIQMERTQKDVVAIFKIKVD